MTTTTTFTPYTAEETLQRMLVIAEAEMLIRGSYITSDIDLDRVDAPCGGRQACAVGSLVLAAGFTLSEDGKEDVREDTRIPWTHGPNGRDGQNVWPNGRPDFMRRWPETARAYDALNQAAKEYMDDKGLIDDDIDSTHDKSGINTYGHMETLFESMLLGTGPANLARHMTDVITRAQRILAENAAT